MAAYRRVDDLWLPAGWLPVHWDQLRAQHLISSTGKPLPLPFFTLKVRYDLICVESIVKSQPTNQPLGLLVDCWCPTVIIQNSLTRSLNRPVSQKKTQIFPTVNCLPQDCLHGHPFPLPSNTHHRSNGDCLEGKRENYQVYCMQQLCTVQCIHIWTDLTVLWIGFCLTGPISLCVDCRFIFVCITLCTFHACVLCSIVTWWGGPGEIEAYP